MFIKETLYQPVRHTGSQGYLRVFTDLEHCCVGSINRSLLTWKFNNLNGCRKTFKRRPYACPKWSQPVHPYVIQFNELSDTCIIYGGIEWEIIGISEHVALLIVPTEYHGNSPLRVILEELDLQHWAGRALCHESPGPSRSYCYGWRKQNA